MARSKFTLNTSLDKNERRPRGWKFSSDLAKATLRESCRLLNLPTFWDSHHFYNYYDKSIGKKKYLLYNLYWDLFYSIIDIDYWRVKQIKNLYFFRNFYILLLACQLWLPIELLKRNQFYVHEKFTSRHTVSLNFRMLDLMGFEYHHFLVSRKQDKGRSIEFHKCIW